MLKDFLTIVDDDSLHKHNINQTAFLSRLSKHLFYIFKI